MVNNIRNKVFFIFRILITVALLFALFKLVPYKNIVDIYTKANKLYIFLGFFAFFLSYFIGVFRWQFLLGVVGVRVSFYETFLSYFSALFFNLFFPSFVAGDIFRGVSLSYRHGHLKEIASTVFIDRFTGLIALVIVTVFFFLFGQNLVMQWSIVFPLLILVMTVLIVSIFIFTKPLFNFLLQVVRNKKWKEKLMSVHEQLYLFQEHPVVFTQSIFLSVVMQIMTPISFYITSKAFSVSIPIIYFLILVPIIMVVALLPITIAGAGTREAASVYFFSLIGIQQSVGLGISLLNLVFMIVLGIVGGILYVGIYHRWLQSRT